MAGVKESVEVLHGLALLAEDYKDVMADGKIDLKDLSVVGKLFGQFGELKAAVEGAKDIPAEMKDLDEAEVAELVAAALAIVRAFKKPAPAPEA